MDLPMDIRHYTDLAGVKSTAHFSGDGLYRYYLRRQWGPDETNLLCGVFMNPSTADERKNDRTLAAWQRRAYKLKYDGFVVYNAFALCSKEPKGLLEVDDPVGRDNDVYLEGVRFHRTVVCGWGKPPKFVRWRTSIVEKMLREMKAQAELGWRASLPLYVLAINNDGSPKHPLYVKGTDPLLPWLAKA